MIYTIVCEFCIIQYSLSCENLTVSRPLFSMAWEISTPSSCLDLEQLLLQHNSNPMKKRTSEENSREVDSAKFYLVLTQRSPVDLAVPVTTFFFASSSNILKASTVGKNSNICDLSCFSKSIYKIDSFIFIIFCLKMTFSPKLILPYIDFQVSKVKLLD